MDKFHIKKETAKRLHKFGKQGEKHNNLINRLIDICEDDMDKINISEDTSERLLNFSGCNDIDDALEYLMDKCRVLKK